MIRNPGFPWPATARERDPLLLTESDNWLITGSAFCFLPKASSRAALAHLFFVSCLTKTLANLKMQMAAVCAAGRTHGLLRVSPYNLNAKKQKN